MNLTDEILSEIKSCVYAAWNNANRSISEEFVQVAEDIWITDKDIETHTDSTRDQFVSYGLILLNERCLNLTYRGKITPLAQGDTYRINGRLPHSATSSSETATNGLFAALIWDMPYRTKLIDFEDKSKLRLIEWINNFK